MTDRPGIVDALALHFAENPQARRAFYRRFLKKHGWEYYSCVRLWTHPDDIAHGYPLSRAVVVQIERMREKA